MSLPAAVATRLRVLRFAVRTTGPQSFISDSEHLRKPKVLNHIPQLEFDYFHPVVYM